VENERCLWSLTLIRADLQKGGHIPTFTPGLPNEVPTAWPRRLKPLLDVLEELGCEPRAVLSEQLFPDAPIGNLNLSTIVGRSTADMKPYLNKLSAAIQGRPNDNDLWQDVCGPLRFVKVSQGLVVVFERAIGTLRPTLH
jgi:hypothetical protein